MYNSFEIQLHGTLKVITFIHTVPYTNENAYAENTDTFIIVIIY